MTQTKPASAKTPRAKKPLTPKQVAALDRDHDGKAGGSPKHETPPTTTKPAEGGAATEPAANGADTLAGSTLQSGEGAATIEGGAGNDTVTGGGDTIVSGEGASTLTAGEGNDTLVSQDGPVVVDPAAPDAVAAEPPIEPAPPSEPADELTAAQATQFPQAQIDATATAAHDAAVEQNRAPPSEPSDAHVQAALDHLELRVSELANFIRGEAAAQGISEHSLYRSVGRRLGEVLGLDD